MTEFSERAASLVLQAEGIAEEIAGTDDPGRIEKLGQVGMVRATAAMAAALLDVAAAIRDGGGPWHPGR
jgi:hypothetical protein